MEHVSVRQKQINVATRMLNLNSHEPQSDWRFLIYDKIGENILAPLFTIQELKLDFSVISYQNIHTDRDSVPGVAAVYFLMPTKQNVERICKDIANQLYDSYYLNFIAPLSRLQLEQIAESALQANSIDCVKKVVDQYLNFIALEDELFILRETGKESVSYHALNRCEATDDDIQATIDGIVEGLFSVFATTNQIPIIRCPKGGAAESVARKLNDVIREARQDGRQMLFGEGKSMALQRPLLCLVDRTIDLSTPLHHTWTYEAMVHDLFGIKLNMVKLPDTSKTPAQVQTFQLSPEDKFWQEQKGVPFPQVAEAVQKQLDNYKKKEDRVKNPMGDDIIESAAHLTYAAGSLQELLDEKKIIEKHTNVATSLLNEIKARKLDNFFEIEEKIMNRNLIDRNTLDEMLGNPDYGTINDKYRLFLISYICDNPNLSDEEVEKYVDVLEKLGCKRGAFEYIKRWKTFSRASVASMQSSLQSSGGILKTADVISRLMSHGSQLVMDGVKNLVLKEHRLPLTKIVEGLMDSSSKVSAEARDYLYLDPKAQRDAPVQRKKFFREAVVFVVGGGSYAEYQNLVDFSAAKTREALGNPSSHVTYGSSELMNSETFLQQLDILGSADAYSSPH